MILVEFPCFSFNFAMKVQHCPITLDQSPTTSSIYSIPGISVPKKEIINMIFDLIKNIWKLTLYQQILHLANILWIYCIPWPHHNAIQHMHIISWTRELWFQCQILLLSKVELEHHVCCLLQGKTKTMIDGWVAFQ